MGGMLGGETHRKEALQGRGGLPEAGNDHKDGTCLLLQVALPPYCRWLSEMGPRVAGWRERDSKQKVNPEVSP